MITPADAVGRAIEQLVRAADPIAVLRRSSPALRDRAAILLIADEVPRRARADLTQASRLVKAARWLAARVPDRYVRARVLRAAGHVLAIEGRTLAALRHYDAAAALFEDLGADLDRAITDSGTLQVLIYLGRYAEAFARAKRARATFRRLRDRPRLARLEMNVGNVLFRQDRFARALRSYKDAAAALRVVGEPSDVALAMRNMAVCLTSLHRFDEALDVYRDARAHCAAAGMPLMVAEADYNIAYLYYLRGDYQTAVDLYRATREHCARVGDTYHATLCDLDEAELCLELNDRERAERLAAAAAGGFASLGLRYERAKALAFGALAIARRGDAGSALATLRRARALFVLERNRAWPALVDLYSASIRADVGEVAAARRLAVAARRTFGRAQLGAKSAMCDLLLTRLARDAGRIAEAQAAWRRARARLIAVEAPALGWRVRLIEGEFHEAAGRLGRARGAYEHARLDLEHLRSRLHVDELKVAFLADKLAVYEGLVATTLAIGGHKAVQVAWSHIEEAKSRSLADLIAFRAAQLQPRRRRARPAAARVRAIGEELHWFDREIERQEIESAADPGRLSRLRLAVRARERSLAAPFDRLRAADADYASLRVGGLSDLDSVRAALPDGAMLIEYYRLRDTICACVVSARRLEIVPLAAADQIATLLRLLEFQLGKYRFGDKYIRRFEPMLHAAVLAHLRDLDARLVEPLRSRLDAAHLVIVPHEALHQLPFHALWDGTRYLCDRFALSYAPSASVYARCATRRSRRGRGSLILGVGDGGTPHIAREVQQLAAVLPAPKVYLGAEATAERLRTGAAGALYVHVATHGLFRRDNPMLSAVRLADREFHVADFFELSLSADLVSLSGCATGINSVVGGDELLGLTRGLLYAGAKALLLTLWDVADASTREFMRAFYTAVTTGLGNATAVQTAMHTVRDRWPHPYYWAPFVLIGKGEA